MNSEQALAVMSSYVGATWDETMGVSWTSWDEARQALTTFANHQEKMLDALLNAQGCRTCDMCPDCGHLAHGAAKDIGHYIECELAEVIDLCRPSD